MEEQAMATTHSSKSGAKSGKKTASKAKSTSTSRRASAATNDAIRLLEQDHRAVEKLFKSFESARSDARKQELSDQICLELRVHTQVEEEIFYPAASRAIDDGEMVDEAIVEHAAAKSLIAEIEAMRAGQDLFDAKVKVLSEQIDHHVQEEEEELFPACRKAGMDLEGLGERIKARKMELKNKLTGGRAGAH
jgi:hemerythrin superfamily protein